MEIQPEKRMTLLLKGWLTHDAMWLKSAIERYGIDEANELNLSAIQGLCAVETQKICKLLGIGPVTSREGLDQFLHFAFEQFGKDVIEISWDWPADNVLQLETTSCFAYKGMTAAGCIDQYKCGIFTRIFGWFTNLGLEFDSTDMPSLCKLHHTGKCVWNVSFPGFCNLEKAAKE